MNKKQGRILIIIGTLLLITAMSLVLWNIIEEKNAEKTSGEVLEKLEQAIESGEFLENDVFEYDSKSYIGILSIPSLDIEVPVQNEWSYDNLKLSPCQYTLIGGEKMIVGGYSYSAFFENLDKISSGDEIYFTSLDGAVNTYEMQWSELLTSGDDEALASDENAWDLTVFTYTWSGRQWVTVRAVLTK